MLPDGAELSPRPEWVPAWDSLSADERRALRALSWSASPAYLSHADEQIGRLLDVPRETGDLDNTLIFVLSDNGASSRGRAARLAQRPARLEHDAARRSRKRCARLDEIGGPYTAQQLSVGLDGRGQHAVPPLEARGARGRRRRPAHRPLAARHRRARRGAPPVRPRHRLRPDRARRDRHRGADRRSTASEQQPIARRRASRTRSTTPTRREPPRHAVLRDARLPRDLPRGWKAVTYHPIFRIPDRRSTTTAGSCTTSTPIHRSATTSPAEHPEQAARADRALVGRGGASTRCCRSTTAPFRAAMFERPSGRPAAARAYVYYPGTVAGAGGVGGERAQPLAHDHGRRRDPSRRARRACCSRRDRGSAAMSLFVKDGRLHYVHNFVGLEQHRVRPRPS